MKVFARQCALILEKLVKAEFLGGNFFLRPHCRKTFRLPLKYLKKPYCRKPKVSPSTGIKVIELKGGALERCSECVKKRGGGVCISVDTKCKKCKLNRRMVDESGWV